MSAWQDHIADLAARCHALNQRQYSALKFTAPGTDLSVGLPARHLWASARATSAAGIDFIRGLPSEEVNTLPHREKTAGVVRASMPFSRSGTLIQDLTLTFEGGRVVNVSASRGEAVLRRLIDTDEGAGRLGEVALVPHSCPVSQTGLIFFNTLLDENAANHLALGKGYKFNLQGGAALSDGEFEARGGNNSALHVDFMIGSGEMDVDGVREDGEREPVMRRGEWAFDV
jgi:aminopeptidase